MVLFGRLSVLRPNGSLSSSFPLTVRRITIGTNKENDIRFYGDSTVDDFHLELDVEEDNGLNKCFVKPINGLFHFVCYFQIVFKFEFNWKTGNVFTINGVKTSERVKLKNKDQIKVGKNRVIVFATSKSGSTPVSTKALRAKRNGKTRINIEIIALIHMFICFINDMFY